MWTWRGDTAGCIRSGPGVAQLGGLAIIIVACEGGDRVVLEGEPLDVVLPAMDGWGTPASTWSRALHG